MNLRKKFVTLMLSLGLVAGMGTAAFAADDAAVNLLPYPNKGEFNKLVEYKLNGNPKPVDLMVQGANADLRPTAAWRWRQHTACRKDEHCESPFVG